MNGREALRRMQVRMRDWAKERAGSWIAITVTKAATIENQLVFVAKSTKRPKMLNQQNTHSPHNQQDLALVTRLYHT